MANEKKEREFQLAMLRLQVKRQDMWSILTLFIAIEFSSMVSFSLAFMNFFFMSKNIEWAFAVMGVVVLFPIGIFLTLRYYGGRGARELEKDLQKELNKIRARFIDKKPVEEGKEEKEEIKEKKENNKKKGMSTYQTLLVLFAILNIILMGFNLYLIHQTNQIHRENLEFQNMMYNFTSVIVARTDYANLGTPSDYSSDDNVTIRTIHYGDLNLELQVVTPHCGKVSVRYKYFNLGASNILDQEKRNQTSVSFVSESDKYEHLVVSGLNQLSDQIHLKARVYLNLESISPDTLWLSFPLGRLFLEAELFDIQTNSTLTKEFSTVVTVEYEPLS